MKVLVVSPTPTHPTNAGNRLRIARLLETVKQSAEVHFLYYALEGAPSKEMQDFWGAKLTVVPSAGLWKRAFLNRLKRLFWKLGVQNLLSESFYQSNIDSWYDQKVSEAAGTLHSIHGFHMVIAEYAFLSKVLLVFPDSVCKIIDTHDRLGDRQKIFLQHGQMPDWFACSIEEEKKGLNRADKIIAIQDNEANYFKTISTKPVITIGVQVPFQEIGSELQDTVGFFASDNAINRRALRFLQDEVWPLVIAKHPEFTLVIAGRISRWAIAGKGVRILGEVKDSGDAYRAMTVAINPMDLGTGLKIKSIEALSFGRYLLSTTHAAYGLEDAVGSAVFIGDTGEELCNQIISIFTGSNGLTDMSLHCKEFIGRYNERQSLSTKELLKG